MARLIVYFLWLAEIAAFTAIGGGTASVLAHVAALLGGSSADGNGLVRNALINGVVAPGLVIGFSLGWLSVMKRNA